MSVQNLSKIFGARPRKILEELDEGFNKQAVMKETQHVIGVHGASFEVEAGEIFVIIGLSGSGKSTLIRCLNMLNKPTGGHIVVDGEDITQYDQQQLREFRRHKISMVFQNFALLSHKNVLDNVLFGLKIRGEDKQKAQAKAQEMIEMVGLAGYENEPITSLSGGMKQRVGLARALANDPEILLMDEAFSALDPIVRRDMQFELLKLQKQLQKTIVFITHDIQEAFKIGDHVAIMKDSRIVQIGTPEEILSDPADEYVEKFITGVDKTQVLTVRSIMTTPSCLIHQKDGPRLALQEMRVNGVSSAFVTNYQLEPVGLVTLQDALRASQERLPLKDIIKTDIEQVDAGTIVSELVPIAVQSQYPIAVVDNNRLVGIVTRAAILANL
jgi:glycine betaine/proline transport system ATP-binding protein